MKTNKGIALHNPSLRIKDSRAGITLIALVITIIVLLILAGISIALLTGENGILTKATTASEQTKQQGALEKVKLAVGASFNENGLDITELKNNLNNVEGIDKSTIKDTLPMTVKVDEIEVTIEEKGRATLETSQGETGSLPSTDSTKPYLPGSDFSKAEGTDLNTGLVIKDSNGNSYVWVEVPKTIFTTATSNTDYSKIETDMQTYATSYRDDYTDTWYDGCGLTESEYNELKNKMLASLYDNGGFWISQYEIGTETQRKAETDALTTPVSKEGMYPYNYVTVSQAQGLASGMNSVSYNSSLLFGIQWDLTLKYIEAKGAKTESQLKTDSTEWGNYSNASFDITKGKYSTDKGATFTDVAGTYTKPASSIVLLTTGATNRNSTLNIYDLAGNVFEWTLEKSTNSSFQASRRGVSYNVIFGIGVYPKASHRGHNSTTTSNAHIGFRSALY